MWRLDSLLESLQNLGSLGIFVGLLLEVIPSELVLAYGGFLIKQGQISFLSALLASILGGTIAQLFLYWLGLYGGRPFIARYGRGLLLSKHHLSLADHYFARYGDGVVFGARFIPIVRHLISIPAGIAQMNFIRFTLMTLAAIIPWSLIFLGVGYFLGQHWQQVGRLLEPYVPLLTGLALFGLLIYIYLIRRRKQH
ncbi:MAG: hypothetical protein RLZ12_506 [Bacillota bacterium]|jgi:membrane protein DedA with SNARE-associated domain